MGVGAPRRLPVVGVMGSGREPHEALARPLGEWLARRGVHLLTGGGAGVMAAVSRAFVSVPQAARPGCCLGVLPGRGDGGAYRPAEGYPNPWVEIPVRTHLPGRGSEGAHPHSRNLINVLSAHVVVALPGGDGTASEVELALRHGRRLAVFERGPGRSPDLPPGVLTFARFEPLRIWLDAEIRAVESDLGAFGVES